MLPDSSTDDSQRGRAVGLLDEYGRTADNPALLDEAVDLLRAGSDEEGDQAGVLANLGWALRLRYLARGSVEDLDAAVAAYRSAVAMTDPADPAYPGRAAGLCFSLGLSAHASGDREKLHEASQIACSGAAAARRGGLDPGKALTAQAWSLMMTMVRFGDSSIAPRVIEVTSEALNGDLDASDRSTALVALGAGLSTRFAATHQATDITAAISHLREAERVAVDDAVQLPNVRLQLATVLRQRFEHGHDPRDLDDAMDSARRACATAPPGHLAFTPTRLTLATVLWERFTHGHDLGDLDEAVASARAALDAMPADHPQRDSLEEMLRGLLWSRAEQVQSRADVLLSRSTPQDVATAVALLEESVRGLPSDHPSRLGLVATLCGAFGVRRQLNGDRADADAAVRTARELVKLSTTDDETAAATTAVAGTLLSRFELSGERTDLDGSIASARESMAGTLAGDAQRSTPLMCLSKALLLLYRRTGEVEALTAAVDAAEEIAAAPLEGQEVICLLLLAEALQARYDLRGNQNDAQRAVALEHQALRGTGHSATPQHAMTWEAVSRNHLAKYGRTGKLHDIDAAIRTYRATLDLQPGEGPHRARLMGGLAECLRMRFERSRQPADIDAAEQMAREAVDLSRNPREHAVHLAVLGEVLRARFETTGNGSDIDSSIAALQSAHSILSAEQGVPAQILGMLSTALARRAHHNGDIDDVHAAVAAAQAAVDITDVNLDDRAAYLDALGTALGERFSFLGDRHDLDAAVQTLRSAIDSTPTGHRTRVAHLCNLGGILLHRFGQTHDPADLDAAIDNAREALAAIPGDHPDRPAVQAGLAILLVQKGTAAALDESIELSSPDAPGSRMADQAGQLHVHANSRYLRYEETGQVSDLKAAVRLLKACVRGTEDQNPRLASRLCSLALALQARFERAGWRRYRDGALSASWTAATLVTAPSDSRLHASKLCGALHLHHGDVPRAVQAYRLAVEELLPQVIWRGLGFVSRQNRIKDFPGLACDAAAAALHAGDPVTAVRLLEQGRALLWSQLLDTRTDRSHLREQHPDLCARFDHVITELTSDIDDLRPPAIGTAFTPGGADYRQDAEYRWRLHQTYTELVEEIRRQPSFAEFLTPPNFTTIRQAAAEGPVVIVNVSQHRCDALIVTSDCAEVRVIPLVALTLSDVEAHVSTFTAAVGAHDNQSILSTLEWLWHVVAEPVLRSLDLNHPSDSTPRTRLWWCPTGQLALLPLHAAGVHTESPDAHWVGDRVVSSYTPTLQALVRDRERAQSSTDASSALIVGMSRTPGLGDLPGVAEEVKSVSATLPGRHTRLRDTDAVRRRILAALNSHRILHFACHGFQHTTDPSASYLAVSDGPLTLRDINRELITDVELAFLSACETARGDTTLADEALHLAAAFGFSGSRHVIGTLWSIYDSSAAEVAREVYRSIAPPGSELDCDRTASALHNAVTLLRRAVGPGAPLQWAPYIHLGP